MAELDWNQFSKRELVQILNSFDQQPWVVERLTTDSDCYFGHDCSCDVGRLRLPEQIIRIKQRAVEQGGADSHGSLTTAVTEHLRTILTVGYTCLRPDRESAETISQLRSLNLSWFDHKRLDGSVVLVAPSASAREVAAIIANQQAGEAEIPVARDRAAAAESSRDSSPLERVLSRPPASKQDRKAAS